MAVCVCVWRGSRRTQGLPREQCLLGGCMRLGHTVRGRAMEKGFLKTISSTSILFWPVTSTCTLASDFLAPSGTQFH